MEIPAAALKTKLGELMEELLALADKHNTRVEVLLRPERSSIRVRLLKPARLGFHERGISFPDSLSFKPGDENYSTRTRIDAKKILWESRGKTGLSGHEANYSFFFNKGNNISKRVIEKLLLKNGFRKSNEKGTFFRPFQKTKENQAAFEKRALSR